MGGHENHAFDPAVFLAKAGQGRTVIRLNANETFFTQGDPAAHIFYLQTGRAKLTVLSDAGKVATMSLFAVGDFFGEESITAVPGLYTASATAITACTALKIDRKILLTVMHKEHSLADFFLSFLLARNMRIQADLVDQRFNSSMKRLARILLLMSEPGKSGEVIPQISQETLAEMIGTTRSRVSFFMNRFRDLGYIEYYNTRIRVHKALLKSVLHEATTPVKSSTARDLVSIPAARPALSRKTSCDESSGSGDGPAPSQHHDGDVHPYIKRQRASI